MLIKTMLLKTKQEKQLYFTNKYYIDLKDTDHCDEWNIDKYRNLTNDLDRMMYLSKTCWYLITANTDNYVKNCSTN